MFTQLKKLISDEEAPTAVEYALMVAGMAVAMIGGAYLLGTNDQRRSTTRGDPGRQPA